MQIPSAVERILLDEETITTRVRELAAQISTDYADVDNLVLVGVLKGSFIFLAVLARRLTVAHHVDFIALSSYGQASTSASAVRLIMDTRASVTARHVLVVEDIVDTGLTIDKIMRLMEQQSPASVTVCTLLYKPDAFQGNHKPDLVGFTIPNAFVVGYGLDYDEKGRNLDAIYQIKE